ncbi:MAG: hypothetical protein JEZ03_01775 [Bacteroidales bacterium]|nr:hypothetical protein [Bacteroidales bacterium]
MAIQEIVDIIKMDADLEIYFLRYMKYNLFFRQSTPPEVDADEQIVTEYLQKSYDMELALNTLLDKMFEKYHLIPKIKDANDLTNQVLIEVCDHYYTFFGEERILRTEE